MSYSVSIYHIYHESSAYGSEWIYEGAGCGWYQEPTQVVVAVAEPHGCGGLKVSVQDAKGVKVTGAVSTDLQTQGSVSMMVERSNMSWV